MADNKSQKEYNDLLKISQSMIGEITKAMDELEKSSDKRNKKLQDEISLNKQILSQIETEEDLYTAIEMLKERGVSVSKQDFGVNQKLAEKYFSQLKAAEGIAESHKKSKELLGKVYQQVDQTADSFKDSLTNTQSFLEDIPVIGKSLSKVFDPLKEKGGKIIDKAAFKFKKGFGESFASARAGGANFTKSLSQGIGGGMRAIGQFAKVAVRALGAVGLIVLGIAAAFGLGLKRFQELEQAASNFRAETGLLNSQTRQLQTNIQQVSGTMAGLGVSAEDVSKAAGDFTNEFGGLEQPSKAVLSSMVALNKNFGIGTQEAAKLNKVFQNISGLTATQSQALIGQTVEMAKMAGVAPQQVIKDMADSSEAAYQFFGGSASELAKAAVSAAALGTSIAEASKVARGLLDYQSSISSELEAGAILGTNINFSQARYLAANGKVLESQQAVIDSVSQLGDLTKLNVYEQEALVQATGMEFSQLVNQQRIRERFGKLKEKELAAAMSLVDAGKDLSKLTRADLEAQNQRLKSQQELQSQTSRFSNAMSGIGTAFMDMLAPIADFLMPILADIGEVLNNVISPTFRVIGSIVGALLAPFGFLFDILGAILVPLSQIVGYVIDGLAKPFNYFIELFNGFGSIITDIGMWFNEYLIEPLTRAYEIGASIASVLTFGMVGVSTNGMTSESESGTTVTSVNDAVISPQGDIISTSPQDYLIATKNPSELSNQMSANDVISGMNMTLDMGGVISELKNLKEAFLSNKDVYLGREKVTAAVTSTQERSGKNNFGMGLA